MRLLKTLQAMNIASVREAETTLHISTCVMGPSMGEIESRISNGEDVALVADETFNADTGRWTGGRIVVFRGDNDA